MKMIVSLIDDKSNVLVKVEVDESELQLIFDYLYLYKVVNLPAPLK